MMYSERFIVEVKRRGWHDNFMIFSWLWESTIFQGLLVETVPLLFISRSSWPLARQYDRCPSLPLLIRPNLDLTKAREPAEPIMHGRQPLFSEMNTQDYIAKIRKMLWLHFCRVHDAKILCHSPNPRLICRWIESIFYIIRSWLKGLGLIGGQWNDLSPFYKRSEILRKYWKRKIENTE